MDINTFILKYGVQPADAIIMRKKLFGMVDHYVIYMGEHDNEHRFIANYTKGVKEISNQELNQFLHVLQPTNIDRFPGPDSNRSYAVRKANSQVGQKAYSYISNNCEHFKNWVHSDEHKSDQVDSAGNILLGAAVVATAGGLVKRNKTLTIVGLGALALGFFLKAQANDNNKK